MTPKPLLQKRVQADFSFIDLEPKADDIAREVLQGLAQTPKELSPKFFYDETGRGLFNEICNLPEYYLTRCGMEILRAYGREIAQAVGPEATVIEYGSGDPHKAATLLGLLDRPERYVSIDISKAHLLQSCEELAELFPRLEVVGVCADFNRSLFLRETLASQRREESGCFFGFFPGSSIGNFTPVQAEAFLRQIAADLGPQGALLIAVDLTKNPQSLHAAYNDARGITARFNKNMLVHLNREIHSDFNLAQFEHYAFFNPTQQRIEMHLVSLVNQTVHIGGHSQAIVFERGESIHTENSYKYRRPDFEALLRRAGFMPQQSWLDERRFLSYYFCRQA